MNIFFAVAVLTWCVENSGAVVLGSAEYCGEESAIDSVIEELHDSQRNVAANIWSMVTKNEHDNIAISPLAAYLGLMKIYFGTRGKTRNEMTESLNMTSSCMETQFGMQEIVRRVQSLNGPDMYVNDDIFYQRDIKLEHSFKKIMSSVFETNLHDHNFQNPKSRMDLREEVVQRYLGFPNVSYPVQSSDDLVLIGTARFLQEWPTTNNTCLYPSNAYFYNEAYIECDYVHKIGNFMYGKTEIAGVEVEYVGIPIERTASNIEMFVILPAGGIYNFLQVERLIDSDLIQEITERGKIQLVHVTLPVFDIQMTTSVTDNPNSNPGNMICSDDADFSFMTKTRNIHVNRIYNSVRFQLKKLCGITVCPKASMIHFNGNHPFIVVVTSSGTSRLVLFMASFTGPNN